VNGIQVECYAGYRGEETPRRFFLGTRRVEALEIIDRWLAPDHRYFKLRADDGATYILRHDVPTDRWEMTLFDATVPGPTPVAHSEGPNSRRTS
jgi:hypothetical protein